jgi:hypothetical protein
LGHHSWVGVGDSSKSSSSMYVTSTPTILPEVFSINEKNSRVLRQQYCMCFKRHRDHCRTHGLPWYIVVNRTYTERIQRRALPFWAVARLIKFVVFPLQTRCGPEGSRRFRLSDFHDIRHMKVMRSSASRTSHLYPQECSWYSFSLGIESTPEPWCVRKEICH